MFNVVDLFWTSKGKTDLLPIFFKSMQKRDTLIKKKISYKSLLMLLRALVQKTKDDKNLTLITCQYRILSESKYLLVLLSQLA